MAITPPFDTELTDAHIAAEFESIPEQSEQILIEEIANWVVKKGLGTFVVFFLEAHKPMRNLSYHALLGLYPGLSLIGIGKRVRILSFVLSSARRVELLAQRIELLLSLPKSCRFEGSHGS